MSTPDPVLKSVANKTKNSGHESDELRSPAEATSEAGPSSDRDKDKFRGRSRSESPRQSKPAIHEAPVNENGDVRSIHLFERRTIHTQNVQLSGSELSVLIDQSPKPKPAKSKKGKEKVNALLAGLLDRCRCELDRILGIERTCRCREAYKEAEEYGSRAIQG